jgi:hypothetical protein
MTDTRPQTLGDIGKCRTLCIGPCEWRIRTLEAAYSRRLDSGYYMCPTCGEQQIIVNPTVKLADVNPAEMKKAPTHENRSKVERRRGSR